MASPGYAYVKSKPFGETSIYGYLTRAYSSALKNYAGQREQAMQDFSGAEKPIQEMAGMFRSGGGYGAGQMALAEKESKKGYYAGLQNLIATGMSSGTNVSGLRARTASDLTTAKLGIEDARVGQLSNALSLLGQLRGNKAQTIANLQMPGYGAYSGALTSAYNTYSANVQNAVGQANAYNMNQQNIYARSKLATANATKTNTPQQHFDTPWR